MIYFVSGPPASGKTTLALHLVSLVQRGVHIPVDDLRLWVKSGLADSVPWTEETERQFQIAEVAACAVARTYSAEGFEVVVDHCRNPRRLDQLIAQELRGLDVCRILLLPDLEVNLLRNAGRTDKSFDPSALEETIRWTNARYRDDVPPHWMILDNSLLTPEQTGRLVLLHRNSQQSR